MIDVLNRQVNIELDSELLRQFAEAAVEAIDETEGRNPVISFVDDLEMAKLNLEFRGNESTTDVLSFSYDEEEFERDDSLGDIVISAERSAAQAEEHGLALEDEMKQLILHGILHLCGYDHETDRGEMNERELELRSMLGII
jgi:probable rRNA maturation factor